MSNVQVVATSGGPHSAMTLASYTLRDIISIAPTASGQPLEDGIKLSNLIHPVLVEAHTTVQQAERAKFNEGPLIPDAALVDKTISRVRELAQGSVHGPHFNQEETLNNLKRVLYHHFATNMNIERKWHSDKAKGLT